MRILAGERFNKEKALSRSGRMVLSCWRDYVFEGADGESCALPASCIKRHLPGDSGWRVMVNFGDYVGLLSIGAYTIEIRSKKLDSRGFDALLTQISARIANLPFDVNAPAFVPFSRTDLSERDRLYHALVYLRWAMRFRSPSLRETWAQIAADPHRVLVREERRRSPWDARGVTPRTLERLAAHPENWTRLDPDSPLASTALARALTDRSGVRHFPTQVVEVVADTCLDVPENRFAKHFVSVARELLERTSDLFDSLAGVDPHLASEARELAAELRAMEATPFLRDIGEMRRFPVHSQVLQKRAEYRELLMHHQALVLATSYPIDSTDLTRIIETKSASVLYEYWCFFEIAEQLSPIFGPPLNRVVASGDELHAGLAEGLSLQYQGDVELHYNRSFSRSNASWSSYSVALRPDIVLRVGDSLHLFDAKFRVDGWTIPEDEGLTESDLADADDHAGVASRSWWKNADIHKMHAYKDALRGNGAKPQSVWVLYPGSEFVFYREDGTKLHAPSELGPSAVGVGAIPMKPSPATANVGCADVLARLLA